MTMLKSVATPPGTRSAQVDGSALVRALQQELIPRLARAHRHTLVRITLRDVEAFAGELLLGDEKALGARLDGLRQQGASAQALCLDLMAPAARSLGEMWNDDRCDFAAVTLGVGQMQRLLRALPHAAWLRPAGPDAGLQLLLAQPPQEQHSMGLSIVAQFFSQAGWHVTGGVGDVAAAPAARARVRHFDVVGFSLGGEAQLDWLRQQISAVRTASCNRQLLVMVGGPLFVLRPQLAGEVGADLCPADLNVAPTRAAQMVSAAQPVAWRA